MYAAQLVKACMRPDVPLTTTKAVTYTALVAGVAYIQPLFGWAGMIGSLAGGVIAGLLSWQAVHLVRVAIALPLVGTALLLRTALQLPKLALTALGAAFRLSWSTLLAIISSFKQSFS